MMNFRNLRDRVWLITSRIAVLLAVVAYGYHVWTCAQSPLFYFPYVFTDSDMETNMRWAKSILEQGWANPAPYHPLTGWMREVGTREEWENWWGGGEVFQQSPLYAYIVAGFQAISNTPLSVT